MNTFNDQIRLLFVLEIFYTSNILRNILGDEIIVPKRWATQIALKNPTLFVASVVVYCKIFIELVLAVVDGETQKSYLGLVSSISQ